MGAAGPRCLSLLIPPNELPPGKGVWYDTLFVLLDSAPAARRKAVSSRMFSGAKYLFAADILKGTLKIEFLQRSTNVTFCFFFPLFIISGILNCFPAALLVPAKVA